MTQTNDRPSETSPDSSSIGQKLEQIMAQLSQFQTQLDRLSELPAKVDRLEEQLLRVSNIYRYDRLQNLLKAGEWLEADKETSRLILAIAGDTKSCLNTPLKSCDKAGGTKGYARM